MFGVPTEVSTALVGHGPAGLIILILIAVIRYIFKRWDHDRERLIEDGHKYAELAWASAKALEVANTNSAAMIAAVQTTKLLAELKPHQRGGQ